MFRQVKIETPLLTPQFVGWFRGLPHLTGDRDQESATGKQRIVWLQQLCQAGLFYSPDWAIAVLGQEYYRVNGGHSSAMLAATADHFPLNLPVILRWFRCDSQADMLELFNHFDNRKSLRTPGDKTKVHKSVHEELADVAPSYVNRMLNGIQCFYHDGQTGWGDEDERTRLIHGETEFLSWAGQYVRPRFMGRSGVIACMYRSFNADRRLADEFWSMVHTESATSPSHPSRVLARFLRELDSPATKSKWDSRAIYAKCLHAWNAWQCGRNTDLKYFPSTAVPDLLIAVDGRIRSF